MPGDKGRGAARLCADTTKCKCEYYTDLLKQLEKYSINFNYYVNNVGTTEPTMNSAPETIKHSIAILKLRCMCSLFKSTAQERAFSATNMTWRTKKSKQYRSGKGGEEWVVCECPGGCFRCTGHRLNEWLADCLAVSQRVLWRSIYIIPSPVVRKWRRTANYYIRHRNYFAWPPSNWELGMVWSSWMQGINEKYTPMPSINITIQCGVK